MIKHLTILLLLFSVFSFSQEKKQLKKHLQDIEKEYDVKFSYSEKNILNKFVLVFPEKNKTLHAITLEITNQTRLIIKKKSKRYYIITTPKNIFTVCGFVLDAISKKKIADVTITLSQKKGVTTNNEGYFSLKNLKYTDTLQLNHLGYTSKKIPISDFNNTDCTEILLNETSNFLDEIIIRNFLTSGVVKKLDGAIVLKPQKQGVLPGLTEADVLLSTQQIPGINSPLESAVGIHVHGGTPDQNLILFNGIKLYNTAHFFGAISAFNPYIIDNVTVYKNASNAKYGNHIAGVIDIKTTQKVPAKSSFGFGFNLTGFDAYTTVKISEKIGVQFSVRRSLSDIVATPTFNKISNKVFQNTIISEGNILSELPYIEDKNDFYFFDINAKVIYQPNNKNTISIQQIAIKNKLDYQLVNNEISDKRNDILNIENTGFGISWKSTINTSTFLESNIYYSNYKLLYDGSKTRDKDIYDFTKKNNEITDINFSVSAEKLFNKQHTLKVGYQYAYNDVSYHLEKQNNVFFSEALNNDSQIENVHTLLTDYVFKKGNIYTFNFGIRTSYLPNLNKTLIAPRFFGKAKVLSSLWINASAELKQQYTSKIVEFFTADFGLENELWALSNSKKIPILKSTQFTAGFLFKENKWFLDVELYHKKIEGLTSLTTGFNNYDSTIFNGNATIKGVDFLLKKDWNTYLSSWISYTFNDISLLFDGFNNSKKFSGNFSISNAMYIAQQIKLKNWNISLGWNYRTGLPFNSLVALNPNNGIEISEYNNAKLPAYHKLDASVTYDFYWSNKKKIKSKIGVSFQNIYNQKNILKRTREVSYDKDYNTTLNTIETLGIKFTPNFVFRVKF